MTLEGQTRWLEWVIIEGFYYVGEFTGKIRFWGERFIN
jgi:hypothetical protein